MSDKSSLDGAGNKKINKNIKLEKNT